MCAALTAAIQECGSAILRVAAVGGWSARHSFAHAPWTAAPPSRRNAPPWWRVTAGGGARGRRGCWCSWAGGSSRRAPGAAALGPALDAGQRGALHGPARGLRSCWSLGWWTAAASSSPPSPACSRLLDVVDWVLGRDVGVDLFLFRDQQARLDVGRRSRAGSRPARPWCLLSLSVAVVLLRRMPRMSHAVALLGGSRRCSASPPRLYGSGSVPRVEGSPGGLPCTAPCSGWSRPSACSRCSPTPAWSAQLREPGRIGTLVRQFTVVAVAAAVRGGRPRHAGHPVGSLRGRLRRRPGRDRVDGRAAAARLVGRPQRRAGRAPGRPAPATTRARAATGSRCSPTCPTSSPRPPTSTRRSTG